MHQSVQRDLKVQVQSVDGCKVVMDGIRDILFVEFAILAKQLVKL